MVRSPSLANRRHRSMPSRGTLNDPAFGQAWWAALTFEAEH